MFTGIIENIALVKEIKKDGDNLIFTFESDLASELKIDQSISHNLHGGLVCRPVLPAAPVR